MKSNIYILIALLLILLVLLIEKAESDEYCLVSYFLLEGKQIVKMYETIPRMEYDVIPPSMYIIGGVYYEVEKEVSYEEESVSSSQS